MSNDAILVTGGDSNFFPFVQTALRSFEASCLGAKIAIGIIDHGFTPKQAAWFRTQGYAVVVPQWSMRIPVELRSEKLLGLVARTALRDYFPGYQIYLWFDGDAWAQTSDFLEVYLEGARSRGVAVAAENGAGYRATFSEKKWWVGNMVAAYGPITGLRLGLATSVNIGIVALSAASPQWDNWILRYQDAIDRTSKLNLDQHAFQAALRLDSREVALVSARFNWICTLSTPVWDPARRMLCDPAAPHEPISIIHLAGPNKLRDYEIPVLRESGRSVRAPLTPKGLEKL